MLKKPQKYHNGFDRNGFPVHSVVCRTILHTYHVNMAFSIILRITHLSKIKHLLKLIICHWVAFIRMSLTHIIFGLSK